MVWNSTILMTFIDLTIIGVAIFAIYSFVKTFGQKRSLELRAAQSLTLVGIVVFAAFYSLDLFSMLLLPQLVPMSDAKVFMEELHLNYSWIVIIIV